MRDRRKNQELTNFIRQEIDKCVNTKMNRLESMVDYCVHKKLNEFKGRVGREIRSAGGGSGAAAAGHPSGVAEHHDHRPTLCAFGHEDYGYLVMPKIGEIVKASPDFFVALQKVIAELFFHPEKKQNHTIYIHPHSYKTATVFWENAWKNVELEFALERTIKRANDVLQHHYVTPSFAVLNSEFKNVIGKKKWDGLREFTDIIDNLEDHLEIRARLLRETEHTISTNQHLAHPYIFEPGASSRWYPETENVE